MGRKPLDLGEVLVEELLKERRYYQRSGFQHNGENINTVRVRAVLLAHSELPDDQVWAITEALYDHLPEIRASTDLAKGMLPGTVRDNVPTRFHPGADRFYCQEGAGGCTPVRSMAFLGILGLLGWPLWPWGSVPPFERVCPGSTTICGKIRRPIWGDGSVPLPGHPGPDHHDHPGWSTPHSGRGDPVRQDS